MFYRDSCTIKGAPSTAAASADYLPWRVGNQYQKDLDLVINKMRQQDNALRDLKKAEQAGILARLRQSMADPVTSLNYSLVGASALALALSWLCGVGWSEAAVCLSTG